MKHIFRINEKLLIASLLFFVGYLTVYGQNKNFIDGIERGTVKVKFAPSMTTKLSRANIHTKNNQLSIGIANFDKVATKLKASNMKRLFPYDPMHEDKLIKHGLHLWYIVDIDIDMDPVSAVNMLKNIPEIAIAECNYEKVLAPYKIEMYENGNDISSLSSLPFNDPYLRSQWNYQNTGQNGYPGGTDINLFSAWETTAGASDIIISIHDEGVDVNHEDLRDNIWINTKEIPGNGIDDDGNGYIDDVYGFNFVTSSGNVVPSKHGTHVAGIIAAVNNNGIGVSGIAGGTGQGDGVRIMSLQVLSGNYIRDEFVAPSYVYAANNGAVISQNSWGYTTEGAYEEAVLDAINYFVEEAGQYENSPMKGGIVIFAAGNNNKDAEWYTPNHDKVLAVSSLGPDWKKASYSNYGTWIDIVAPGGDFLYGSTSGILSTVLNNQYAYMEGTSMACPHVTAIAALALANRTKQMTNTELLNKVVTGIKNVDLHNSDYLGKLGLGAIDATLAIKNDENIPPDKVSDLVAGNISQEDIELIWSVPLDKDDGQPLYFHIYHSTDTITSQNVDMLSGTKILNTLKKGAIVKYNVVNLSSNTKYYFAVKSQDRWGNIGDLSDVVTAKTSTGAKIVIEGVESENIINMDVDASISKIGNKSFSIKNDAIGTLRWESVVQNNLSSTTDSNESFLSLDPSKGVIEGHGLHEVELTADVSNLKNGLYKSKVIIKSNDSDSPEYDIDVRLKVKNHPPQIIYPHIADFSGVELGQEKVIDIILENIGLGDSPKLYFSIDNPRFEVITPQFVDTITSQEKVTISLKYKPIHEIEENGILNIYSQDGKYAYKIHLTGAGKETSEIQISPDIQRINSLTIGDEVSAVFKVANTGKYPLKYFIPRHDDLGISDDWEDYHSYGYKIRSSDDVNNPISYSFQDISTTGVDITAYFQESTKNWYYEVDMGFLFPFYGKEMEKIYITRRGYTAFDNTVNPNIAPKLNMSNTPRGYISPLGFHSVDIKKKGRIYYKVESDKVIIQYTDMWKGITTNPEMNMTAQMILYPNGNIRFYYDDITGIASDRISPVVLIESYEREDGILLSSNGAPYYLKDELALGLDYPGPDIIKSVQNGSGIIASGDTATVKVYFETSNLKEGTVERFINIINNDPVNKSEHALVKFDVIAGGIPKPEISKEIIDFGNVYKDAEITNVFRIKNRGTADINITNIISENNKFNIGGEYSASIQSGLYRDIEVSVPSSVPSLLEDLLLIKYANGETDTVKVRANVISRPDISLDLSSINLTTNIGDIISYPYSIANTGESILELSIKGNEWINFHTDVTDTNKGYYFSQYNDGNSYEWIDIRITGKRLQDVEDTSDMNQFWQSVDLPFTFNYYGMDYNSLKVSPNGVITLGNDDPEWLYTPVDLPLPYNKAFIFPFWIEGSPDVMNYGKEVAGVYYQCDENKCVISWEYMINSLNYGAPTSFQAILYKNGHIKFQYRSRGTLDFNASLATIGLQEAINYDYLLISKDQSLDYGSGLSFVISPNELYQIEPNESVAGTLNLNTNHVMGGTYNSNLQIYSNVPGKELLEKNIDLIVNGVPGLAIKDTLDFGNIMNINKDSIVRYKSFFIVNSGTALLEIFDVEVCRKNQYMDVNMPYEIVPSVAYTYPKIEPGKSIIAEAIFSPNRVIGDFEDMFILKTNAGIDTILVMGSTYEPPVLNIEKEPISIWLPNQRQDTIHTIRMNNIEGKYPLEYKIDINYLRDSILVAHLLSDENSLQKSTHYRELNRIKDTIPQYFYGTDGKSYLTIATKYNSGNQSFNMSGLKTYFKTDDAINYPLAILAEVRVGEQSLSDSKTIARGSLVLNPTQIDTIGKFYTISLDNPAEIYPNEDFYAIIEYPLDIANPQGYINDTKANSDQYFYMTDNGDWVDFQQSNPLYSNAAWLMSVIETEEKSFDWLINDSERQGAINMGDSTLVDFKFIGASAKGGYQYANITFSTNDPKVEKIDIPVKLYVNQGPIFQNAPDSINVFEGTTNVYEFDIVDIEGDKFTIEPLYIDDIISCSINDTKLILTIAPKYGDAGIYAVKCIATDINGASTELNVKINVFKSNRAPIYIGHEDNFIFNTTNTVVEYNIRDLFIDPDGDDFTFKVESQNENIIAVSNFGTDYFSISPLTEGITNLIFTLTDEHGAISIFSIKTYVRLCNDNKGTIVQKKNNMLQFNNIGYKKILSYQWFQNNEPIPDATQKLYVVNKGKKELDFTAEYILRIITESDTVYTCPYKPIREGIALHVTPNPVRQGEQIKIEIGCSDADSKTFNLRIISLSGHVLKSFSTKENMFFIDINFEKGTYLIELSDGKTERVVRLVVM